MDLRVAEEIEQILIELEKLIDSLRIFVTKDDHDVWSNLDGARLFLERAKVSARR